MLGDAPWGFCSQCTIRDGGRVTLSVVIPGSGEGGIVLDEIGSPTWCHHTLAIWARVFDILFHSLWLLSHGTRHKDKSKLNLYEGSKKPSELQSQLYTNVQDLHVVLGGTRPDGYRGHLLAPSPLLAGPTALL